MGKFKFRFNSLSRVKDILKTKTQKELALINVKIEKKNSKIEETKLEVMETKRSISQGNYKVAELHYYERHGIYLNKKLVKLKLELDQLKKRKVQKLEELVEKTKDKKIFEMLEKKHLEDYKQNELNIENSFMDEIAIQKAGRK